MRQKVDLVQQAIKEIEGWIKQGKYDNGELLPSEGAISEQLDMSRATVRDAIRVLEVRGYLERIHGVGVRVNDRSVEVAINFMADMIDRNDISPKEVLDVRRVLEPQAAALAALNASQAEIETLRECVQVMESEKSISTKHHKSDYTFHETMARAGGNKLLYAIVSSYRTLLYRQISASDQKSMTVESQHHYHRHILESIENRDAKEAKKQILIHLDDTEKNLLSD